MPRRRRHVLCNEKHGRLRVGVEEEFWQLVRFGFCLKSQQLPDVQAESFRRDDGRGEKLSSMQDVGALACAIARHQPAVDLAYLLIYLRQ